MIAISLTAHETPRVVMELMSNIRYAYNDNAIMIVHVSRDTKEKFLKHAAATGVRMSDRGIYWNDLEMPTRWGNTLPMQVSNFLYLTMKLRIPFSHFQILSPANLVVGENMDRYITAHDVLLNNTIPTSKGWMWHDGASQDSLYARFRDENGLGETLCARVDGAAVRADIFGDFVRRLLDLYSLDSMRTREPNYPLEETLLPTYLTSLKKFAYRFGLPRSKTFEPHEPELTLEKVEQIIAEGKLAYLKRISPHPDNPVRQLILSRRSFGLT